MEEIKGIVYLITNLINGKVYIGQTRQEFKARIWQHKYHARKENPSYLISRAIKKYGHMNFDFEIICTCSSPIELNQKESYYISEYDSTNKDKGYNVMEMQDGVIVYSEARRKRHSENTKKRFVENENKEVRGRGWSNKKHTKYTGCYFVRGKYWISSICCNLKKTYLGSFRTETDAAIAYDIAAVRLFGESTKLNFPHLLQSYKDGSIAPNRRPPRGG